MTPSLIVGDGNWAVKSDSLLGYKTIDSKYYPREMTFTRATTGTRVNEAGLVEVVPYNLLSWSEQFDNSYWLKDSGVTVNSNVANAPNGTLTADRINFSAAGNALYSVINLTTTAKLSVYLKGEGANIGKQIYLEIAGTGSLSVTLTGEWNRFVIDANNANSIAIKRLSSGQADSVLAWGIQLVDGTQPLDYLPTTTRLNIPRIDYSTGSPALLLEPQRTNISYYSESSNPFISAIVTNAPDLLGMKAYKVQSNFSLGDGPNVPCVDFVANTTYTVSAYIDFNSLTGTEYTTSILGFFPSVEFALMTVNKATKAITSSTSGGGVWTINTAKIEHQKDEVYRVILTATTNTAGVGARTYHYDSTDLKSVNVAGIQVEASSYPTSYIQKTTSASVTRNADQVYKTGISSLIGQTEGTIYLEADLQKHNESEFYIAISNGSSLGEAIYLQQPSSGALNILFRTSGLTPTIAVSSANWDIGLNKIAIAYNLTSGEVFMNGVSKGTVALTALPTCSQLTLGARPDAPGFLVGSGGYKVATLFKTRLSNSELATLTTI